MKGVKEDPYFEIPVIDVIPSQLHLKLGEVMNAVEYINNFAAKKVQPVSEVQHRLRQDVIQLVADIKQAMEEKEYWDSNNNDAGKALLRQLDKQQNPSQDERASLELQIATENAWKNQLKASLKTMRDAKTAKVKQLIGFASARKTEEDSLVTGIDNIYQEFNIFRAQYHGGDMAGGHLSLLMMDNAVEKVED